MPTRRSYRREIDGLKQRLAAMTADRNAQRSLAATHLSGLSRVSEMYTLLHDGPLVAKTRLARMIRAHAKTRALLEARDRQITILQRRLDDALGRDSATDTALNSGSRWQLRRSHKPQTPAEVSS